MKKPPERKALLAALVLLVAAAAALALRPATGVSEAGEAAMTGVKQALQR